ncbi:methyltransferase domain-containing protein [Streptomonospora nanhaiensis]|uniref:methyltransferase domain-containing protein n=1 Tax=Streptomonospora nanhaiensis TaxID=1323731 RepID=UPI001C38AD8D|nr:methyltransferase domain-containing protein [Streptomonospora nanhaiensis]MBV2365895.1 class I SAM-dependent methyltransferase [Streptomonospora nanhaiensis]MBX9389020.1 class I SAM-dependent methyltransferase [Streptomonospora nanhaiensis]
MADTSPDTPRAPGTGEERGAADFAALVAEAAAAPVEGWDFSWLAGRATEERPSWGYSRLIADRLARAESALDIDTGGGEVLGEAPVLPPRTAATESWPPNLARAAARLRPRGAAVVATGEGAPLPFADSAFDLVVSRHPVATDWAEVARVLRPGGTYLSQQVGPASVFELTEFFLGPQPPEVRARRNPDAARAAAVAAGLEVVDLRMERLRMRFHDIGAVVYFLRKVVWIVPGFDPAAHRDRLRELHERIRAQGPFTAHSTRFLIEARKPR